MKCHIIFQPFLKTVTAKMTELLPTKIANWFSLSSTSSSTNGSAIICDVTDSSSDDETESVPLVEQPPKKRRRFHLSSKYIYPDHEEVSFVSVHIFMLKVIRTYKVPCYLPTEMRVLLHYLWMDLCLRPRMLINGRINHFNYKALNT